MNRVVVLCLLVLLAGLWSHESASAKRADKPDVSPKLEELAAMIKAVDVRPVVAVDNAKVKEGIDVLKKEIMARLLAIENDIAAAMARRPEPNMQETGRAAIEELAVKLDRLAVAIGKLEQRHEQRPFPVVKQEQKVDTDCVLFKKLLTPKQIGECEDNAKAITFRHVQSVTMAGRRVSVKEFEDIYKAKLLKEFERVAAAGPVSSK